MKTKRQRIVDAVVARMQAIRTANGFETDAGALVAPWAVRFDEEELSSRPSKCALAVYDLPDEVSKESKSSKGSTHRLRFQVRVFVTKGDRAEQLRAIIGDIVSAVGSDTLWTEEATGKYLAMDTEPGEEGFVVPQEAMEIAGGAVEFTVVYATALFDPYN
jgi:hypothetical protein